ncbi:AI-2E family transporter [Thiothrix litoralis]|jgi:putative permease|uniref:AI-2E family transporter n=1 Tax=Thiothrix litoralis TaxID=2891210 RepID=A0ABX7WV47_9GAMM|nr:MULTISPECIES: AI-2E family transporter [Thiothrix]QTR47196.1 AI-2E family transporter [Thiothrix litoralis]WMP17715.1 AI-2E family transporter [Thiothrix lacustris]
MLTLLNNWYTRHFSNPQVAILALLLLLGLGMIVFAGQTLAPLLAAIIIAYLLDGAVDWLRRYKLPRFVAVVLVFSLFALALLLVLVVLAPLILKQTTQFVLEIPGMVAAGQNALILLPDKYPTILSEQVIMELLTSLRNELTQWSGHVLSFSLSSVFNLLAFIVYLVVVPLLVFFFLKDKDMVLGWFSTFLPRDRELVMQVWREVNKKIAGYVRGKFMEILIVWVVSFVAFIAFDLRYSMLLSFLVGISVLIPYVGAAVVTLPIAVVAYFQWGFNSDFAYVIIAYAIIQFFDGNLLVPLLFAEMVNLHPTAIITAVLFFGAVWGIWGVFFAIPLATLIHAVINAWPRNTQIPRPL